VYLRTLLIVVLLGMVAVFTLLNWGAIIAPTTLSVGLTTFEAPLGLVLLAVIGALALLFLIYLVYLQASSLAQSRQYARELQTQRELADRAEESRFNQLRSWAEAELQQLDRQTVELKAATLTRLDELERELRLAIEHAGNSLAAYIGEVEDRLERASGKTADLERHS
jgi:hypothetical protein